MKEYNIVEEVVKVNPNNYLTKKTYYKNDNIDEGGAKVSKEYDKFEELINNNPNNRFTQRTYYKNDEVVMKQDIDGEEDKTQRFKNGLLNDGENNQPAVVIVDDSGFQFKHYKDGKLHNENGPAIIHANFPELNQWHIDGKELSKLEITVQKIKIMKNKFLNKPENLNNGMDFKNKMTP